MEDRLRYVSTRGQSPPLDFADVLVAGLATDGGLYVPEHWPDLSGAFERTVAAPGRPYADVAVDVIEPFVGDSVSPDDLRSLVVDAYDQFDHPDVAPLVELGGGMWVMELFHGPTLAFKDYALQVVGRLFDHVLAQRDQRVTIVGATSGDTGSAAIEACRDREALDIVILHPHGRVSDVQRRQMTTVDSMNVHNVAIDGTFDDCQDLVKAMFADTAFRDAVHLSAVNSINWARVMAQVVYYVVAAAKVGRGGPVSFSVPTGNFGNMFAGEVARRCGVPIRQLVIGSNRNDILTRFLRTGTMTMEPVVPTISPSMDIGVSSNLERLLFELMGRDGVAVADLLTRFRDDGTVSVPVDVLAPLREHFDAASFDDDQTRSTIASVLAEGGPVLDPHGAIGVAAGRACRRDATSPMVCLATAHPAKFPDAVEEATGSRPRLPGRLADLMDRAEHFVRLPAELTEVEAFVQSVSRVPSVPPAKVVSPDRGTSR
ncbi:MAG TPA: threonine synthase [Acidimicrobiales bacterium]